MPLYSLYIINKAGGLVYQKDFTNDLKRLGSNEYLVLAGTFHGIHAITARLTPAASTARGSAASAAAGGPGAAGARTALSGIQVLETSHFKLFCFPLATGTKMLLIANPQVPNVDIAFRLIYDVYADYVMKNPFYTPEMPIRAERFDQQVAALVAKFQ
ncbi:hypothetical protein CXG81DRAFT_30416 [Caulochytrium protostelioides]|uniref:Trafficking protein particle complex subunit n=1 Tax=Caulochytrium protostelioides TaxID=1555241 RepID=A0A4P9WYN3_9FUNG|nr:hypothetical protein CXG81DRAFT_30416 [Caulochytrium protostelioides]|eukprot:RKO98621.1 hypothetical protein CXG81DRAFT_30416 [Caulochytrium protostelioides]